MTDQDQLAAFEARIAAGIHDSLVRISIGLEHPDDLVEDLAGAISAAENCSVEQTLHA